MSLKSTLEEYGLKERHALIYIACLELGPSSIQKISQKSGFARSTCEAVLGSLQQKGFVTSYRKKHAKYFSPEDPKKIIQIAKNKSAALEGALPQLLARYGKTESLPTVRQYEGKQGMISILEEILEEADELLGFISVDELFNILDDYFPEFRKRRIEKRILVKVILKDSPVARERQQLGPSELREVRIMPEALEHRGAILIWKDKITMFSLHEDLVALVIESKNIAATEKAMFSFIWDSLPSPKKTTE